MPPLPPLPPPNSPQSNNGSMASFIAIAQSIAAAINDGLKNYLSVQGTAASGPLTTTTLVKQGAGRVAMVNVLVAGSVPGAVYDTNSASSTAKEFYVIPNAVGTVFVNFPVGTGIVVAPGTGQTVTISYS